MDLTEQELFEAATSAAPMQELAQEPAQTEQTADTARDEKGRFAPKAAEQQQPEQIEEQPTLEAQPTEAAPKQGFVPSGRLKEEADARRAEKERADRLESMLTQMLEKQAQPAPTPPKPAPDIYAEPDEWGQHLIQSNVNPVIQRLHESLMYNARMAATSVLGADKVSAAEEWFAKAAQDGTLTPEEAQRINASPNPYEAGVKAHQKHLAMSTVGDDLETYNKKIIADYLASQQAGQAAPAAAAPARSGPTISLPSLSKVGATSLPSRDGEESDAALWATMTRPKR